MSATLVITMAGRGQRFRDAGHDRPKYEIEVRGRTLFSWSMDGVRSWIDEGAHVVFIARAEDAARAFLETAAPAEGITTFEVVELDATTDGQATTALLAEPAVRDRSVPFVVFNIDTHVRPGAMRAADARGEGWVPCFPGEGDKWSFARAEGEDGRVVELAEKRRISEHATVGLYWFGSFERYAGLYEQHFAGGAGEEVGERYIAPMYNTLITDGHPVYLHRVAAEDVVPLGTPDDVAAFAQGGTALQARVAELEAELAAQAAASNAALAAAQERLAWLDRLDLDLDRTMAKPPVRAAVLGSLRLVRRARRTKGALRRRLDA